MLAVPARALYGIMAAIKRLNALFENENKLIAKQDITSNGLLFPNLLLFVNYTESYRGGRGFFP